MLQQLCTTCFTLSGFSLTSFSIFIGLYKDDLSKVSLIVSVLLLSTVLYVWAGEMAREGYRLWKYTLAETMYMSTSVLLFGSLLYFVVIQSSVAVDWRVLLVMLVPIVYLIWRIVHNIEVITRVWWAMR